jgi:hypothetical protein
LCKTAHSASLIRKDYPHAGDARSATAAQYLVECLESSPGGIFRRRAVFSFSLSGVVKIAASIFKIFSRSGIRISFFQRALQKSPVAREVARSFADAHTKNCKFRDMFPRT